MGRVAVDLYSQQIGARLEDVSSFAKYLGGSSGNVAYGTARQGLRSSMLARVGDEHMGRFLREELSQVGCDTSHLITDKDRLTALVLLGIKDRDTFPLIFYRDNCADMAITASDVDESYIASARCLAITGTHLSHPQTREAVLTALGYARRHGVRTVLDIDYRPVLWGLTSLGDGETRFIAAEPSSCPKLTRGQFRYDFGDEAGYTPLLPMFTLGHNFAPAHIHAGGLRYHGAGVIVSQLLKDKLMEAVDIDQLESFDAGTLFAQAEGIIPAPESCHAIAAAIKEANKCKETGEEKVILFNLSGHGLIDMAAYDKYLSGDLQNYALSDEEIAKNLAELE